MEWVREDDEAVVGVAGVEHERQEVLAMEEVQVSGDWLRGRSENRKAVVGCYG